MCSFEVIVIVLGDGGNSHCLALCYEICSRMAFKIVKVIFNDYVLIKIVACQVKSISVLLMQEFIMSVRYA